MLHKTRGIVFKTTDYGESSVIVQDFLQQKSLGCNHIMVNGARKPKGPKISRNMLQRSHLLDMVVYHKSTGEIYNA